MNLSMLKRNINQEAGAVQLVTPSIFPAIQAFQVDHCGGFHGHKSGHGLNNQLVRKLLSEPYSYEIVTFDQVEQVPEAYARQSTEAA